MKKRGKMRFLSLFLAAALIFTLGPMSSFAEDIADADNGQDIVQHTENQPADTEVPDTEDGNGSAGAIEGADNALPADQPVLLTDAEPEDTGETTENPPKEIPGADNFVCKIGEMKYETLAEALEHANAGDIITLLQDVNENIVLSKTVTVDLNDKTLTGTGSGSVVRITVAGVTLKNGTITGGESTNGGGLYISAEGSETIQLQYLTVSGNKATNGGAIYQGRGIVELQNCVLKNNTASNSGGGIYQTTQDVGESRCTMADTAITGNTATVGGGLGMGASHFVNYGSTAQFIMESGSITGNSTTTTLSNYGGGGVYLVGNGSRFTMNGGEISSNITKQNGGGIFSTNWHGVTLNGGKVVENNAGRLGGGIYIKNVNAKDNHLEDEVLFIAKGVAISGNSSGSNGGGIAVEGAVTTTVANGTILYNNTAKTMGDDVYQSGTEGALNLPVATKMGGKLRLASDGYPITGWYYDGYEEKAGTPRWSKAKETIVFDYDEDGKVSGYHKEEGEPYYKTYTPIENATGTLALKAAHDPIVPIEGDSDQWEVSKSKTATNLDASLQSRVTLSLPSAEEAKSMDVVFVLDKSTSDAVENDVLNMLAALQKEAKSKDAKVNVGVVIFNKVANRVCELTDLETGYAKIEEAIKTEISSGTNLHAGLLAGKAMLDEDEDTAANRKYLITVSDGITYMFDEDAKIVPYYWMNDGCPYYSTDTYSWSFKYGNHNAPEDWGKWIATIRESLKNETITPVLYDKKNELNEDNSVSVENMQLSEYTTSVDRALYKSYEVYNAAKEAGYHCFAVEKETTYDFLWGPSFMNYLAGGKTVDFSAIEKEILYLVDAGSKVTDKIGKTDDYNFDFVNPENMVLKVGDTEYQAVKADGKENVFTFGKADADGVYPYVVTYHPESETNADEYFDWEINVPVSNFAPVQLTYTVKLTNPKTEPGIYGEYDADGSQNKTGLYTNNDAILYPVDSNGDKGMPEKFNKPTVSYTVNEPYIPPVYTTVSVQKVWKIDDGGTAADSVQIELLRDGQHYETQTLSAANGWRYTWSTLPAGSTWMVREVNVPEGFTSSVSGSGNNFVVTNDDDPTIDDPNVPLGPGPDDPTIDDPNVPLGPGPVIDDPDVPLAPAPGTDPDDPKTGDDSDPTLWLILMGLSCIGAVSASVAYRKRRRRAE